MYRLITTNTFEKNVVRCAKRGLSLDLLQNAVKQLENNGVLPANYKPHILSGNYSGYWEAHIKPDWLLIWIKNDIQKTITLIGTGTHSDLFK
jgi:mRNA interferase YafQ